MIERYDGQIRKFNREEEYAPYTIKNEVWKCLNQGREPKENNQFFWDFNIIQYGWWERFKRDLLTLGCYPVEPGFYDYWLNVENHYAGYFPTYPGREWLKRTIMVYRVFQEIYPLFTVRARLRSGEVRNFKVDQNIQAFITDTLQKLSDDVEDGQSILEQSSYGNFYFPAALSGFLQMNVASKDLWDYYGKEMDEWNDIVCRGRILENPWVKLPFSPGEYLSRAETLMWYYAQKEPFDKKNFERARDYYHMFTVQYVREEKGKFHLETAGKWYRESDPEGFYMDFYPKELRIGEHRIDDYSRQYGGMSVFGFGYTVAYGMKRYGDFWKKWRLLIGVSPLLAELYAVVKNQGRSDVSIEMKDYIDFWLEAKCWLRAYRECSLFASGLAWIGLEDLEAEVLEKLEKNRMPFSGALQSRRNQLARLRSSSVRIHDVKAKGIFFFDSSSLDWKVDDFDAFFQRQSDGGKRAAYSLAVHKWSKNRPLLKGQKVNTGAIYEELRQLTEDYDGMVRCSRKNARAVNLETEEYPGAMIFRFTGKRELCTSVLFYCEKFGRNLNLVIYTLFTPDRKVPPDVWKKYCLGISANPHLESFRESILQVVDEVLAEKESIYGNEEDGQERKTKWFE